MTFDKFWGSQHSSCSTKLPYEYDVNYFQKLMSKSLTLEEVSIYSQVNNTREGVLFLSMMTRTRKYSNIRILSWPNIRIHFFPTNPSPTNNHWWTLLFSYFLHLSLSFVILVDSSTGILTTYWSCPSNPCVVLLACVHLTFPCIIFFSRLARFVPFWAFERAKFPKMGDSLIALPRTTVNHRAKFYAAIYPRRSP